MAEYDLRQRFLFGDSDIRGEIVRLDRSVAEALGQRHYPLAVHEQLAESLAAVCLLGSTLKFQGRLSLQAQGSGPLRLLLAETTHDHQVRALARHDDRPEWPQDGQLAPLLGEQALMALTIKPEQGQQYQGLVPLEQGRLAGCLEDYFRLSEQLPTRLWLAAGHGHAAGLLLQRLPDQVATPERNRDTWEQVTAVADTLSIEELLDLPVPTVLHRLFHELPPELPPATPIRFGCTCSRQRVESMLESLGVDELRHIARDHASTPLEVACDFCGTVHALSATELTGLLHRLGGRSH